MRIIESGNHGNQGSSGSAGHGYGGHGGDGTRGTDADPARDIIITLTGGPEGCGLAGTHHGGVPYGPSSEIWMAARGGNGGGGGNGGAGHQGHPGSNGANATQSHSGGNGGPGGRGGNGGHGANGGNAGHGGQVKVSANQNDMDLFMLVNQADVSGGSGGRAGSGGAAGAGGRGGSGGSSYSWTTQTHNSNNTTTTHHHSKPGGSNGPSGPSGSHGNRGANGQNGRDGSYSLVVDGVGSFSWRYVARTGGFRVADLTTGDGIFEPGEDCETEYTITNTGPMPTPATQRIMCSIVGNDWIRSPTISTVNTMLMRSGQTSAISAPIHFVIPLIPEPPPNAFFLTSTWIVWACHVERVTKFFSAEELGEGKQLTLQYPLRCSPTHGPATVTHAEVAPLSVCVHNLSNLALGAHHGRVCRVQAGIVRDGGSMIPAGSEAIADLIDMYGTVQEVYSDSFTLAPHTNLLPGVFVKFRPCAKQYMKATLGVQLFLGDVRNFTNEKRIQRVTLDVQLASYYARNTSSDMLVVTSHSTSRAAFLAWNAFGANHKFTPNFWNATIHDGLTLEQIVNGSTLLSDYPRRTLVVENCDPGFLTLVRSDRNAKVETPFDTVCRHELAKCMRQGGTGLAILGAPVDWRNKLLPTDMAPVAIPVGFTHGSHNKTMWQERLHPYALKFDYDATFREMCRHFSENTAWQITWGVATTYHGEDDADKPVKTPFDGLEKRLASYFAWHVPFTSPVVLADLTRVHLARGGDGVVKALEAYFGPEEIPSTQFRVVHGPHATDPGEARRLLVEASQSLYDEVSKLKPQWKFIVVYDIAPHLKRTLNGVILPPELVIDGLKYPLARFPPTFRMQIIIGKVWLSRAGDRDGACAQHLPTPRTIPPEFIESPEAAYTILKATPFCQKLNLVSDSTAAYDNSIHLTNALLSDLVEEQMAMRRFLWLGPLLTTELLDHTPRLCAFVARAYEGGKSDIMVNVASAMRLVLKKWSRWYDGIMVQRMWRVLSVECDAVLATWAKAVANRSDWTSTDVEALAEQFARGPGGLAGSRSTAMVELQRRVMPADMAFGYKMSEAPPQVVTDRWHLDTARERCIALFKLKTDFGATGSVTMKTTRAEQNGRQSFLCCPGYHAMMDVPGVNDCRVCHVSAAGAKHCPACNWTVCQECWGMGNSKRWSYNVELEAEPEPEGWSTTAV